MVAHAQPAAHVEGFDRGDAGRAQRGDELEQLDRPVVIGLDVRDLGPEVHREPAQVEERFRGDSLGDRHHFVVGDPELRGLLAGPGVGMRFGRNVGIDADPDVRGLLALPGHGDHDIELRGRLDVEEPDARADRVFQLGRGLADTRKDDGIGLEPGRERAAQLPHRDDVGARAQLLEYLEDAEVAVRLHRVADAVRDVTQGVVQGVVLGPDQVGGVDVHRSPHPIGDRAEQRGVEA